MSDKTILEQWRAIAYDQQADRNKLQRFWANYFNIEKGLRTYRYKNYNFVPKHPLMFNIFDKHKEISRVIVCSRCLGRYKIVYDSGSGKYSYKFGHLPIQKH